MFAGPRKSITALFLGDQKEQFIGREISGPTKSFATRAWAGDRKMSGLNNKADPKSTENTEQLQTELRHAHMSLLAERARVQDLESQIKLLMEQKYSNQSNIIDQLRTSQDRLREQLHLVIQSKMDLCESTSTEIERLRITIAELTSHIAQLNPDGNAPVINIDAILSKYKYNNINAVNTQSLQQRTTDAKEQEQAQTGAQEEEERAVAQEEEQQAAGDERSLEEQLNEPGPANLRPFPHRDISRIDIRTMSVGDTVTYPDPFATVDLKYTGYKYMSESNKWAKFTSFAISTTVFETRLGSHENIIGLEQAVLSMTKGEVAKVWVPSRLGYGVHGAEPLIPPNTDLVFKLTLVEIRNDYAVNQDENDPLDPHQLAHIQQDSDDKSPNGMNNESAAATGAGGQQLTSSNLNTLNNMNNMQQSDEMLQYQADQAAYNAQENELLGYDVDEYASNQQNSFQVL